VVEGQTRLGRKQNPLKRAIRVLQQLDCRHSERFDAGCEKPMISSSVPRRPIPSRMGLAVHLDSQAGIAAEKVENVGARRVLAPKF
jgi:hypothetical protein